MTDRPSSRPTTDHVPGGRGAYCELHAHTAFSFLEGAREPEALVERAEELGLPGLAVTCLLYTSDAADELLCVDLGGRRISKKKHTHTHHPH